MKTIFTFRWAVAAGAWLLAACVEAAPPCEDVPAETVDAGAVPEWTICIRDGLSGSWHSSACCIGCWNGATCEPGVSSVNCGTGGKACDVCAEGQTCGGRFTCVPIECEASASCGRGEICMRGTCR